MPNIVEYTNKEELTPSDKGIQAATEAAHVYSRIGNEVQSDLHQMGDKIEQHMAVMETSELYKTGTELKLNLQTRYEKESALPENRSDPHFGDRFMAEVGPQLDQWGKGAQTEHGKMLATTLKSSIRNEIFNHVAAGQSEMDAAHVQDNATQTINTLGSGLITDPSATNLTRTLGTAKDAIQGMTMAIPDVGTREQVASELTARYMPQLVLARYGGVAESIKNQIAETGKDTAPALGQLNKDVAAQLGFQYLSPEVQAKVAKLGEEAVRQGQTLYNSKHDTAKAQTIEAGKAAYADIHNKATELALKGQGPTPELIDAAHEYSRRYGATNPGEVASLDDFIMRGQDRAQNNAVQPYDQKTRDSIQTGFSLPKGDPRRPTQASLLKAYSAGLITKDDLSSDTAILDKLDKPETDPAFKPAWENFQRWQAQTIQSIGNNSLPGTAVARAQFLHDSTANFMARGKNGGDWDKALDMVTNVKNQHNFTQALPMYQRAAQKPDAAKWISEHGLRFGEDGSVTPAYGSTAAPVYPTKEIPAAHAPAAAADIKKADEIIWGKH